MKTIQLFLQGEGVRDIRLVEVSSQARVHEILKVAAEAGFAVATDSAKAAIFAEDADEALVSDAALEAAGIAHHSSVHIHRCRKVAVTVHFNGGSKVESFGPGATISRIKKWAVSKQGFNLTPVDSGEHVLQVTGTQDRPDDDAHVGTLVGAPSCAVAFDLVAKVRVEGSR
jgi:hypothetical protein